MTATITTAAGRLTDRAVAAFEVLRRATAAQRSAWLTALADHLDEHRAAVAADITADTGKPSAWADIEVERAASITRLAAAEALARHPQAQRLDVQPAGAGRLALIVAEPLGPVLALTPFNFPLHLAIHKIAPAIAAGTSVIVVPSPRTPRTAAAIGAAVGAIGLPDGAVGVVTPDPDHRSTWDLITDPRIPVISFTGSDEVGWRIVDAVPRKHVVVELGGNAAAVIADDYLSDDDLRYAATRLARFSFYNAGQACTSVQRVYAPAGQLERVASFLVAATGALDVAADVGPVIDAAAAHRIRDWVGDAIAAGARRLTGDDGTGRVITPTVLLAPPRDARVVTDEVFGPVVSVLPYDDFDDALAQVNTSRYGLSAGIFTHDVRRAFHAAAELTVGQVVIGDVPTFRSDVTPFGGVKDSGRGREGVRAAIDDYTVSRTIVLAEAGR
ncbi:MAG: aldehyde dehydrogenase family protein [Gordonia sp. (in: high G+C Gram-positive bacteria)]